jgi:hypothetical protein
VSPAIEAIRALAKLRQENHEAYRELEKAAVKMIMRDIDQEVVADDC